MENTILKLSDYKMNCSDIENLASDYLDSDLAESMGYALNKHANECSSCSSFLNELAMVSQWASELGDIPPSNEVSARLREKLRSL